MTELEKLEKEFRDFFENQDQSREQSFSTSSEVTKLSSKTTRKMHQKDFQEARRLPKQAKITLISTRRVFVKFPEIQYAGFLQNAEEELIEALSFYRRF
ncbi:MAG: hypothetical protein NC830_04500 [Candidatus Omnitrophica bacterium]|nr:hypothetical protein [Candidatus Omnitrophota bacterium]